MPDRDWMLLDCNAMLGRNRGDQGVSFDDAEAMLAHMKRYGIGQSLVYGAMAKGYSPRLGNERLLDMTRGHQELLPVLVALPAHTGEFPETDALRKQIADNRVVGVRLCPKLHAFALEPWCVGELMELLNELRMPTFIDLDIQHWSDPVPWDRIAWLCEATPDVPVILTRVGCGSNRNLFPLLKRYPKLYFEISYYTAHLGLEGTAQRFGAGRMLFGTDAPIHAPACPIGMLYYSALTDEEKRLVAGGNMRRLIGEIRYAG